MSAAETLPEPAGLSLALIAAPLVPQLAYGGGSERHAMTRPAPIHKASEVLAATPDPGRVRPACARLDFDAAPGEFDEPMEELLAAVFPDWKVKE